MTAGELRAALANVNPDAEVFADDGSGSMRVERVEPTASGQDVFLLGSES